MQPGSSMTVCAKYVIQLGCIQSTLDPALFYFNEDNVLQGLFACHVDDVLHAGNEEFDNQIIKKLKRRFQAGKLEETIFKYVGFNIQKPIPQSC